MTGEQKSATPSWNRIIILATIGKVGEYLYRQSNSKPDWLQNPCAPLNRLAEKSITTSTATWSATGSLKTPTVMPVWIPAIIGWDIYHLPTTT
ncbi:MAG: hypothetical protein K1565_17345 [Candidatus Thiodiazotropha sp. (ex. Lucinisca nassula)]|nr:hypothetical protein [Candidatus Thiodiazotropha sp. (ex. Lucinisca nassula)]